MILNGTGAARRVPGTANVAHVNPFKGAFIGIFGKVKGRLRRIRSEKRVIIGGFIGPKALLDGNAALFRTHSVRYGAARREIGLLPINVAYWNKAR